MQLSSFGRYSVLILASFVVAGVVLAAIPMLRVSPQLYRRVRASFQAAQQTTLGKHLLQQKIASRIKASSAASRASSHSSSKKSISSKAPSSQPFKTSPSLQHQLLDWVRDGAPRIAFYKVLSPQLQRSCSSCHQGATLDFPRVQAAARLPHKPRPHTWMAMLKAQSSLLAWALLLGALLSIFSDLSPPWRWGALLFPLTLCLFAALLAQRFSPFEVPRLLRISSISLIVSSALLWLRLSFLILSKR
ncbi:MAG: hypothetical protein H6728_07660 [Myxococcales bacterium]|nr:hypothetical protein [Myxococcales bacterium]